MKLGSIILIKTGSGSDVPEPEIESMQIRTMEFRKLHQQGKRFYHMNHMMLKKLIHELDISRNDRDLIKV